MNISLYQLAEAYQSDKTVRFLIKKLLPLGAGSIIDDTLANFYAREKEKKLKAFFDELSQGNIELTEDVIESEEFLQKYFITIKAVLETTRLEKVKFFARLFLNSDSKSLNKTTYAYDDFVKVLDDLTYQELFILSEISKYEKEVQEGLRFSNFFRTFRTDISKNFRFLKMKHQPYL